MENRIVFNFFDNDKVLFVLCKHFNLDKRNLERFIAQEWAENQKNLNTHFMCFDFIKNFNLPIDKIDTANVFITAKHLTTLPDKGLALKRYGLLNLKDALEKDTPLNQFLKNKEIEFNVNKKKIKILGMDVDLFRCNDDCKSCSISKKKCAQFSPEYRKAVNLIYIKFYSDKCETEVFLCGKDKELEQYPFITRHPEFLHNVDSLLMAMKAPATLSKEWGESQKGQFYIIEFDVCIKSLEYIHDKNPSYDLFENYFNLLGYTESDFASDTISDNFYNNVFLIRNSLDVFFGLGKKFGQIIPSTIISPSDLRISQKSV